MTLLTEKQAADRLQVCEAQSDFRSMDDYERGVLAQQGTAFTTYEDKGEEYCQELNRLAKEWRKSLEPVPAAQKKTCLACSYCFCEPDDDFTCGHPDSGPVGLYVKRGPVKHCGDFTKFKQHPLRNPDGSLKSQSEVQQILKKERSYGEESDCKDMGQKQ